MTQALIISLDGVRYRNNYITTSTNENQLFSNYTGNPHERNIIQPTELGETLKELNKDELEFNTRMSGIDMRARLNSYEIMTVLALDALVGLGFLPTKCLAFTRQKKRLSVSLRGLGREDIVRIVSGKNETDAKKGGWFGGSGWFGNKNQNQGM
jgi:hypothetical protein